MVSTTLEGWYVIPDYIGDGNGDQQEIMEAICDGIGESFDGTDCDGVATGNDKVSSSGRKNTFYTTYNSQAIFCAYMEGRGLLNYIKEIGFFDRCTKRGGTKNCLFAPGFCWTKLREYRKKNLQIDAS